MFQPKYIKQGKLLQKGVKKFLKYKQDIITDDQLEKIQARSEAFREALNRRDKEEVKRVAKELTKVCEKSVPEYRNSGLRENLEVLFVAIVIAVGIRAYFLQPFKIPTGSMQPTLNGIIGHDMASEPEFEVPGFGRRFWDRIQKGRKYLDFTMEREGVLEEVYEVTRAKFFTSTRFVFRDPSQDFSIPAPLKTLSEPNGFNIQQKLNLRPTANRRSIARSQGVRIPAGTVIARGFIDTGDQVLVDKVSYHFRTPRRGEVFVFNTRGIDRIHVDDPRQGSMHYIKRLAGIPGDNLRVEPPLLLIDGKEVTEPGFQKVMHDENYRPGYTLDMSASGLHIQEIQLNDEPGSKEYFAMGDNSGNSSDSRAWGSVPEANLVGPALVVYWPFTSHWGRIR